MRLRRRARALRALHGPEEMVLFTRVLAFASLVPLLMRLSLPRLERLLSRGARPPSTSGDLATAEHLAALVELAQQVGSPLVAPGCVTRSVTLYWFLTRAGFDVELCFGLGELGRPVPGHCWLTLGGEPFLERTDPRAGFVEMYRVPAPRGT